MKVAVLEAVPPGGGVIGLVGSNVIETPIGVSEKTRDTGGLESFTDSTVITT